MRSTIARPGRGRTGDFAGFANTSAYDRQMLCGRDPERARIGELLAGARASRSAALVVTGEPGVGKSALLEDARGQAADMCVLRAAGVESEAQLPFAGVQQLLRPVLDRLPRLPEPQAAALGGALGLTAGGGEDRFLVSLAVLSLLADAAERHPVLCLVDDAHWLDEASADALSFVARRLEVEGIVMLFAARKSEVRRFEAAGLPELELGGLDPAAAELLIDRGAGVALPAEVRHNLVAETGGNPLALLELSSTLSKGQLSGAEALIAPLPVSARVEKAFLARVRQLPEDAQTLILVAAADGTGDLATVLRAAAHLGASSNAFDDAEQAGLLRARDGLLELRHPLVRSAIYQAAPLSRRQAAHRALADVLDGESEADRRAWHRAAATVEPDPSVGEELERAAERARQRSGYAAASLAFERAAGLTAAAELRARRLTAAAESAWLAGRGERALMLLEAARPLVSDRVQRADLDRYAGLIEMTRGVPADACSLLLRAAGEITDIDTARSLQLLNLAGLAAAYAGDNEAAVAIADVAREAAVEDNAFLRMLAELLIGLGAHARGDFADAAPRLRVALDLAEGLDDDSSTQPVTLLFAGRAALYLGDDRAAYRTHHEAAARARAGGALTIVTQILPRLVTAELWAGRWPSAAANAREGLQLARQIGQHDLVAQQLVLLALVAAVRGADDECRSLAEESRGLAAARGLVVVAEFEQWALAALELGLGRAEEAFQHSREISRTPVVLWAGLDRIEAAVRMGEGDTARAWLDVFQAWAESGGAPWARAVVMHCRALLSRRESDAEALFLAALELHAEAARPFELARTELAYGEFLRRGRRRVEARRHLRAALHGFETLGAQLWAERARVELRATGQTARKRDPSTRDELTPQELQIARFVAEGRTNRDVAAQLFLSPRTIDFHLRNVYKKLGITSRTALARLELDSGVTAVRADTPRSTRAVRT
jgi:DNA-binding CsgD family transcriptional regulator